MDDARAMRAACEARLESLDLPWPFDLDAIIDAVAQQLGQPIVVKATDLPDISGAVYGASFSMNGKTYVFHDPELAGLHRAQVVLHELAHQLCGHTAIPPEQLLTTVDVRHGYRGHDEDEAEMLATLIHVRCTAPQYAPAHGGDRVASRFSQLMSPVFRRRRRRE